MSLVKRTDWPRSNSLLADLFDNDRFFASPWLSGRNMPAVNIKENEKNYEVELAVPGYDKKDFEISIDNGLLIVSAEKSVETEKKRTITREENSVSAPSHVHLIFPPTSTKRI